MYTISNRTAACRRFYLWFMAVPDFVKFLVAAYAAVLLAM